MLLHGGNAYPAAAPVARPAARNVGYLGKGEIVPFVNRGFEWGVVIATFLSVLSIVPLHCARLTDFLHPKLRKIKSVVITPQPLPGGAQEAFPERVGLLCPPCLRYGQALNCDGTYGPCPVAKAKLVRGSEDCIIATVGQSQQNQYASANNRHCTQTECRGPFLLQFGTELNQIGSQTNTVRTPSGAWTSLL